MMGKPSKLKRAIKEMENEIVGYRVEIEDEVKRHESDLENLRSIIRSTRTLIDKLKKIDSEKNEKRD